MSVKIKLHGTLKQATGKTSYQLEVPKNVTLQTLLKKLAEMMEPHAKKALMESGLLNPESNMIIIVNGKEASALNGLDTEISADDEVVLIPISHGG